MNAEQIKQAELILHASNVPGRIFTYSQDAEESREMKFNYFDESIQLRRFAQDEYGTISDAYILYMISMLEYATPDAIREMLYAYARSNKLLSIAKTISTASKGTEGSIEPRIQVLLKEGSIFRVSYKVESKGGNLSSVSIYGATKATQTFVNVKLDKKMKNIRLEAKLKQISLKPETELMQWLFPKEKASRVRLRDMVSTEDL